MSPYDTGRKVGQVAGIILVSCLCLWAIIITVWLLRVALG